MSRMVDKSRDDKIILGLVIIGISTVIASVSITAFVLLLGIASISFFVYVVMNPDFGQKRKDDQLIDRAKPKVDNQSRSSIDRNLRKIIKWSFIVWIPFGIILGFMDAVFGGDTIFYDLFIILEIAYVIFRLAILLFVMYFLYVKIEGKDLSIGQSIICLGCNNKNPAGSEFCIECGISFD